MKKSLRTIALLVGIGTLAACDNLETLERNVCGNTVIERGEDCDGAGLGDNLCNEACRLECTQDRACPPGWGCGADGLCRQPSGFFESFGNSINVSSEHLALADVDGDGRGDVVATRGGSVSILFAEAAGLSPAATNITFSTIDGDLDLPGTGDIDGDGRLDFAVRLGTSMGLLRGQQDRTLSPQLFSRRLAIPLEEGDILVAGDFDYRLEAPGDELLAFGEKDLRLAHTSDEANFLEEPLLTWSSAAPKPFFVLGQALAYGFEGSGEIRFFVPLQVTPDGVTWNQDGAVNPEVVVSLPGSATVKAAPILSSLRVRNTVNMSSQDAQLLLVPGDDGGEDKLFYAFTNAGFGPDPFAAPMAEGTLTEVDLGGPSGISGPLFSAVDLDDDEFPDLVGAKGLFVSECAPEFMGSENCAYPVDPALPLTGLSLDYSLGLVPDVGDTWTSFQFAGAGLFYLGDVYEEVLVTTEKPGFLLYRNIGSPFRTTFRIPTSSPVKDVALGDFNGDGSRDIAFSQISRRSQPGGALLESIHISFGDALGLPTPPVDLGDVGEVKQVFSARLFPTTSGKSVPVSEGDGVMDLVVRGTRDGETSTYVFAGSTDGQVQSPLDLPSACAGTDAPSGVPRYSAIADLSGEGGRDLAVVFRREEEDGSVAGYDLWSLRPTAGDNEAICASLVGPAELPDLGGTALSMLPVDLDDDGVQELAMFASGSSTLLVAKLTAGSWAVSSVELGAPYVGVTATSVFSTTAGESGAAPLDVVLWSETGVLVLRNEGTGALDPARASKVSLPETSCVPDAEGPPSAITGVAAVHLHPDAGRELVLFTEEEIVIAEIPDPASGTIGPPGCTLLFQGGGATAVTSGDVDGDGVEDLVVARPGGVQVLAGIPVVR